MKATKAWAVVAGDVITPWGNSYDTILPIFGSEIDADDYACDNETVIPVLVTPIGEEK